MRAIDVPLGGAFGGRSRPVDIASNLAERRVPGDLVHFPS
jgi:hypothetical protein